MSEPTAKGHQQAAADNIHPGDRRMFDAMDREQLYEYMFMLVKNIWRVDGLYFLGIEKRHDMEEATEVDAECWRYMGKVEAKELGRFLGLAEPDPAQALWMLRHTSWAVSHHLKSYGVEDDGSAWFTVDQCRTQLIRVDKGLEPHPCRQVREGYLQAFLRKANPALQLETVSCPPDVTMEEVWCKWRITA